MRRPLSNQYSKERKRLTVLKNTQSRWSRLLLYSIILRYSRRRSNMQVATRNSEFRQDETNWFGMYSYCHTFSFQYGDRCGYWRISNPGSHGNSSTQLSQTWNHWWLGPGYTQQVLEQGVLQYLQPFEGCRHMKFWQIVATLIANGNVTINNFTVVPSKI